MKLNYEVDSWQYYFIEQDTTIYDAIRKIKENEYDKNKEELKKAQTEYNELKETVPNFLDKCGYSPSSIDYSEELDCIFLNYQ